MYLLHNYNNHEKDYGFKNKWRLGPTIYVKKILAESMITPDIHQVPLKSKEHLIFIIHNIYIY